MKHFAIIAAVSIGFLSASFTALAGEVLLAQAKQSKTKWPECFCTDRYGKRHDIGDIICLSVDDRSYEAKCVMAQNNPFWRDLNRGCLNSSIPKKQTPFPTELAALYQ
ncbi:MAG: hypothetical protein V3V02_12590 [Rhizobiaceae bacterium]